MIQSGDPMVLSMARPFKHPKTGVYWFRRAVPKDLREGDVRKAGDHWVIHITPEAGTVKTDQARDVVLHEHLVAKGFPEFVQASKAGHLFLVPAAGGDVLGPLQGLKNRLAEFAREPLRTRECSPIMAGDTASSRRPAQSVWIAA